MPKGHYDRARKDEGNVMVADTPVKEDVKAPVEPEAHELLVKHPARLNRTVLHGYGEQGRSPDYKHKVDYTIFVGGVARNVPKETAKAWALGLRPEGSTKPYAMDGKQAYSTVEVIILDDDATEADIQKASGVQPMATSKFAQLLKVYSVKDLANELGPQKTIELAEALKQAIK